MSLLIYFGKLFIYYLAMLDFPHYSNILFLAAGFIFIGSLSSFMGVYFWIFEDRSDASSTESIKMLLSIIGGPLFLIAGVLISIFIPYQTYQFRSVRIADVSEFTIVRSKDEFSADDKLQVRFNDKAKIREMLASLNECEEFSPDHETFRKGFKLNLVFTDKNRRNDLFLSVYKESTAGNGKTSVMAHIGFDKNLNLGNYNCPRFQKLVGEYIDPLLPLVIKPAKTIENKR